MAAHRGTAIWSPEAIADLDAIWSYYERVGGQKTAEKIAREIETLVATHPLAGRSRDELRPWSTVACSQAACLVLSRRE
jgi:plasmid stabilization system protein ParE